jgi:hypothetical protein
VISVTSDTGIILTIDSDGANMAASNYYDVKMNGLICNYIALTGELFILTYYRSYSVAYLGCYPGYIGNDCENSIWQGINGYSNTSTNNMDNS